jgi:predicted RNA methylase
MGNEIPANEEYIQTKYKEDEQGSDLFGDDLPLPGGIAKTETEKPDRKPDGKIKDTDQIGIAGADTQIIKDNDGNAVKILSPHGQAWRNPDGTWTAKLNSKSGTNVVDTEKDAIAIIDSGMERAEAKEKKEPEREQIGIEEIKKPEKTDNDLKDVNTPSGKIAIKVKELLKSGDKFTFTDLTKISDEAFGGTQAEGTYTSRDAYDAMELGVNLYLLEQKDIDLTVDSAEQAKNNVQKLRELLKQLPTQTKSNTEHQQFQQFSTPPNIAYIASWIANINENDTVLEPSAGIGGLAVFAKANGANVIVNELSKRRLEVLKNMPFDKFYNENAEHINDILYNKINPTVVIMNPPFSATAGRMSDKNSTENAKKHIEQALAILKDNGRLVAIVGQGMSDNSAAFSDWWKDIKAKYNVRANIGLYSPEGASYIKHTNEYKKYGTTFGVQLLVIDKTGPTTDTITKAEPSLEKVIDLLEGIRNDKAAIKGDKESQPDTGIKAGSKDAPRAGSDTGGKRITSDSTNVMGQRERSSGESERQPIGDSERDGERSGSVESGTDSTVQQSDKRDDIPGRNVEIGEETVEDGGISTDRSTGSIDGNESVVEAINIENAEQQSTISEDTVYSEYTAQKLKIDGAKPHVSPLVQSTAMASVEPPDVTYSPHIPKNLIDSGELSIAQLESIVYAGMQHSLKTPEGIRKGFFIGDGTGVGKGRQIAGIILDNWNQGRKKAVWVTKNGPLYADAVRDWVALGGSENDVFEAKAGKPIEKDNGILFTTYYTLPQGQKPNKKTGKAAELNRIEQIVNWVGKDFDGVIVFDESHLMSNLLGNKPAEIAKAGVKLQETLPNARVLYASATGATEVENFAYGQRLGLWGKGTSFSDVNDFVQKIKAGGLAAMELVARDMKAMGLYIARNISFIGVKYNTVEHQLTDIQAEIYDTMAEGWQIVLQNINEYLKKTGQDKNSKARRYVMQNFWNTQQRFFNQVLTSMQMPTVITDMKKRLANGESCVLQLVNTNAAAEEREASRIKEQGGSLDDMDITPKGALLEMIDSCFPTQKYEEYIDDNGRKGSRPVVDSKGNPVQDTGAVKAKENLMKRIEQMQVPNGPLDMILQEFGVENVTEVTGRTRRFVYKKNKFGELERVEESRTKKIVENDVNAFINDKKQILVFSDAGGTGKSYHAGRDFKNQRHRIHYLIQAGWNASKAVQGFGRTHRTNQVSAPEYVLVTTNLKGQKRFITSIARRLDQLGALTKGQRQTGSSGLFSAKDNLESKEARDALELFYRQLVNGRIPGLEAKSLLTKMGIVDKIIVQDQLTKDVNELRDVTRFLNRILVLKSNEQNQVFDEFARRVDYIVEEAIKNGTLDVGLENYKSAGAIITEEKVVHTDQTGAETKYLAITAKQRSLFWDYKSITKNDDFIGFYRNIDTGDVRAAIRAIDKTNSDGSISKMFYMQSPTVGKRSHIVETTFKSKWEKISKKEEKQAWDNELKNEPKFIEEKLHLISGALLPIWNRLPEDHARVIRITTDDGNSYLGRLVPSHQIDETLRRLGVSRTKETFNVKDSINKVLNSNMIIRFVDKTSIKRTKVAGEYRLEIKGSNLWAFERNYEGVFSEKIGSEWKWFIPKGDKAVSIIEQITESTPILEVIANRSEETDADVQKSIGVRKDIENLILNKSNKLTSNKVEPISRTDITEFLREVLDIPIEVGKFRGKAKGIFKVKPEVIRVKQDKDIETLFHEVGHFLDKKLNLRNKYFKDELMDLGETTSLPSYSNDKVMGEGVAEFVRLYVINPSEAKKLAPKFYDYFETKSGMEKSLNEMFETLRIAVDNYINQDAESRVLGNISIGKRNAGKVFSLSKLYTALYDELHPMEVIIKKVTGGTGVSSDMDFFKLAWLYRGVMGKAEAALKYGRMGAEGKKVAKSFEEILKPVEKELNQFRAYAVSARTIELHDRGIETGIRLKDAEEILKRYKDKGYNKVLEELVDFQDKTLDMLVESGIISESQKQAMRELNKQYVPFYRVIENANKGLGKGLEAHQPIKGIKGSTKDIIDPIESIIKNVYLFTSLAERNKIGVAFAKFLDEFEGLGKIADKVPPRIVSQSFTLDEIKKSLEGAGADIESIDLESIATIFRAKGYTSKDNVITVYKNGKPEYYEIFDKDLYEAFTSIDSRVTDPFIKILSFPARLLRAGAILNPDFMARNPIRDAFFASVASEYGFIPVVDTIKGLMHVINQDEIYQKWMAAGGANSSIVSLDRDTLQKNLREMLSESLKDKTLNIITHPVDILRALSEFSEEATRVRVFEKGLKKEGDTVEGIRKAALASRDATIDFMRFGTATRTPNKLIAFFNAGLQGPDKIARQFKKKPVQSLLRALLYITLPSILTWFFNKDDERYKELHQYEKDLYWIILTKNNIYRIPKPFELGMVFGTLAERMLDSIFKDNPDAFEGYTEQLFDTVSVDFIFTSMLPYIETLTNYDLFRNRPIVPVGEQNLMPSEQYGRFTSETAKLIGKTFNMSPRKIDHILKGYGAGMAQYSTDLLDSILIGMGIADKKTMPEKSMLTKIPFVKGLTIEPYQNSSSVDKLYKELNELEAKYNTARKNKNLDSFNKLGRLKELRKRTDVLNELRKIMNSVYDSDILSAKEKKEKINEINMKMINVAKGAYKLKEITNKESK